MPQVGWLDEKGEPVPFETALAEAKEVGEWQGLPYEVLSGIYRQETKARPDAISVTQLLGCPRKVFLEATEDYYTRPASDYAAFRGSIVHSILEENQIEGSEVEVRVERVHREVTISGQPDSVLQKGGRWLIRDWKTTKEVPYYDNAYTHHQQQVNIYRWIKDLPVHLTDMEIVYLSMSGVKIIPLKRGGRAKTGRAIPNQIMTDEEVEAFLDQKLLVLDAQRRLGAPVSYDRVPEEDLWQCDYCPVKSICYSRAAQEARAAWAKSESVDRLPPREKPKRGKK